MLQEFCLALELQLSVRARPSFIWGLGSSPCPQICKVSTLSSEPPQLMSCFLMWLASAPCSLDFPHSSSDSPCMHCHPEGYTNPPGTEAFAQQVIRGKETSQSRAFPLQHPTVIPSPASHWDSLSSIPLSSFSPRKAHLAHPPRDKACEHIHMVQIGYVLDSSKSKLKKKGRYLCSPGGNLFNPQVV